MTQVVPQRRHPSLQLGTRAVQAADPDFRAALAQAHAARWRPRCLCQPGGVEMYVARLADRYIVKRLPDSGHQHAPDCPSFQARTAVTDMGGEGAAGTLLRLGFALSKRSARHPPEAGVLTPPSAPTGPRLSLRGLLQYLWDEAGLTLWRPGFAGRRSWATVHRHLLMAAQGKVAGGLALPEILYVPEPFIAEHAAEIRARRRANWARAAPRPGGMQALQLVIAEVKRFEPLMRDHQAVLRQVPDLGFRLDAALYRSLAHAFGRELGLWGSAEGMRMVMGATFALNAAGAPAIEQLCLMPVTAQWLPVETLADVRLLNRLVREGRPLRTRWLAGIGTVETEGDRDGDIW
jgi:hypothetical protein